MLSEMRHPYALLIRPAFQSFSLRYHRFFIRLGLALLGGELDLKLSEPVQQRDVVPTLLFELDDALLVLRVVFSRPP